jgi:hypothetical protein
MLHFSIGCLIGFLCTFLYFQWVHHGRTIELTENQVLLMQGGEDPPQVKSTAKSVRFFGEEPTLFTLQTTELSFVYANENSLLCQGCERIDLQFKLKVTPKKEDSSLNELLSLAHPASVLDLEWQQEHIRPACQGAL